MAGGPQRPGFSRGFTPGFLNGPAHQMLVQGRFPKTRGVRVGTVVGKTGRGVIVALAGADLVFDEGHPEQDEQGGRVYASNDPAEQRPGERGASAPCSSQQGADTPPLAQQK